jgi:hypothetical protein
VKITSKEASDKGQSESPQEDRGADILSASVSTRKGSRYSRRLANLTLSFTTGSASRGTEKPGQGSDLAQPLPPTIQVHINNGRVEDDVLGGVHGVERALRYGIFPGSLKVLEAYVFVCLVDICDKGFSPTTYQRSRTTASSPTTPVGI